MLTVWVLVATEVKEDKPYLSPAQAKTAVAEGHAAEKKAVEVEKKVAKVEKKVAAVEKKAVKAEKKAHKAEKKAAEAEKKAAKAEKKAAKAEKKAAKAEKKAAKAEKVVAAASHAGTTEVADVIEMNNPKYKKHKKGICIFTHKKHAEDYQISCGACHHDDKGQPLKDLKMGDPVQNCIACHAIPAKAKPPKGEKWSKEKKREYHANAIHDNCITCHKKYNKKNKTKAAPASCKGCHPKAKKKK